MHRNVCSDLRTILQLIPMHSIIDRSLSASCNAPMCMSRLTPSTQPLWLSVNASSPILMGVWRESCERSSSSSLFFTGSPFEASGFQHIIWTHFGEGEWAPKQFIPVFRIWNVHGNKEELRAPTRIPTNYRMFTRASDIDLNHLGSLHRARNAPIHTY